MGQIYEVDEATAAAPYGYKPLSQHEEDDDDDYLTEDEEDLELTNDHWLSNPRLQAMSETVRVKGWRALEVAGHLAWIFTTSMLLVGLPVLYAYDREKALPQEPTLVPK